MVREGLRQASTITLWAMAKIQLRKCHARSFAARTEATESGIRLQEHGGRGIISVIGIAETTQAIEIDVPVVAFEHGGECVRIFESTVHQVGIARRVRRRCRIGIRWLARCHGLSSPDPHPTLAPVNGTRGQNDSPAVRVSFRSIDIGGIRGGRGTRRRRCRLRRGPAFPTPPRPGTATPRVGRGGRQLAPRR